jgi:hypothetical protein
LTALPSLGERVNTSEVRERLEEAERVLALIAGRDERARLAAEFQALKARSDAFTQAMADRAEAREKALAAAEMPVPGLSFATIADELVVTFNGEPFEQASSAEQLRVSTAIAMAANPKLRVLRIKDGSLLDKNSLAILSQTATDNDFQIWGEFVGEEGAGIIMEGGVVRGAPEPERVEPPKRRKKADAPAPDDAAPDKLDRNEPRHDTVTGDPIPGTGKQATAAPRPARRPAQAMTEFVTAPKDRLL